MSLPAIDCIGRGVANLRGNWELVLLQLTQTIVCSLLAIAGGVGILAMVGASFLLQLTDPGDWQGALDRLQSASFGVDLLLIAGAAMVTLVTVVGLVYCWFQAGILAILERGERQAPRALSRDPALFRTFSRRAFVGWSHRGVWRLFGLLCVAIVGVVLLFGLWVLGVLILAPGLREASGTGLTLAGCLGLLPPVILAVALNLWFLLGMTLLAREGVGLWRAAGTALAILWQRLGATVLIALLFIIASVGVGLIFWPLSQGMATALESSVGAWLGVEFLLTLAQWLVNGILTVALFASIVALTRGELDRGVV